MSYHVDVIPNRNSPPPRHLPSPTRRQAHPPHHLRQPLQTAPQIVDGIRAMLRGGQVYRPGEEAFCSCGALLGLGPVRGNDMLDWLLGRQAWIEKSLARRHLEGTTLLLYDVSSSYLEGRCSPLAAFGHNRDGKQGKQQIVFGLLCAADGCPVAVDVFAGHTADPSTVGAQVKKVQQRSACCTQRRTESTEISNSRATSSALRSPSCTSFTTCSRNSFGYGFT